MEMNRHMYHKQGYVETRGICGHAQECVGISNDTV